MNTPPQYYVLNGDQQLGPYTETELRNRAVSGAMPYDTLVWREGLPEWTSFSDCFPLPPYDTIPPVPRHHPPQHPSATTATNTIPRYPKWPWIGFLICLFCWGMFGKSMLEIEQQALPYIIEYDRMHSTEYAVSTTFEAFVRGALGDSFGKADEEYQRASQLEANLLMLYSRHQTASIRSVTSMFLTIVFAVLWIWKHRGFTKILRSR